MSENPSSDVTISIAVPGEVAVGKTANEVKEEQEDKVPSDGDGTHVSPVSCVRTSFCC